MYPFNRLFSTAFRIRSNRRSVDRVLPPELSRNVVHLKCKSSASGGLCNVYLVGTVHFFKKSIQDVKAVVKFLKPQVVFLELCASRADYVYPSKKPSEFEAAYEEARTYGAEIGEKRYRGKFARTPFWQIVKMGLSANSIIFEPSWKDYYKMSNNLLYEWECRRQNPIYMEIMVDERDQYMSAKLLKVARKHKSVVAVVGKTHLLGIQKYWQQPIELSRDERKLACS